MEILFPVSGIEGHNGWRVLSRGKLKEHLRPLASEWSIRRQGLSRAGPGELSVTEAVGTLKGPDKGTLRKIPLIENQEKSVSQCVLIGRIFRTLKKILGGIFLW